MTKISKGSFHIKAHDFDMDIKEMDFQNLNIFVGANGSGKTFIFKFLWFAAYMAQVYKVNLFFFPEDHEKRFAETLQKIFDYTFISTEDITGRIEVSTSDDNFVFAVAFKSGKLDHFNVQVDDIEQFKVSSVQRVTFASKETRSFEDYERYLKTKKMLGFDKIENISDMDELGKLCEFYRLYDVLAFEHVGVQLKRFSNPENAEPFMEKLALVKELMVAEESRMKEWNGFEIKEDVPYLTFSSGESRKISTISSGVQSMIMMLVIQL
jgi:hypothetical protein